MIKTFLCRLCVAAVLAVSFGTQAYAANLKENTELLSGFQDYNHQVLSSEKGSLPDYLSAALGIALSNGLGQFVNDITSIELATCMNESKIKSFMKNCKKAVKKSKLPEVFSYNEEGIVIKYYAETGRIICLTNMENELCSIVVITGTPSAK